MKDESSNDNQTTTDTNASLTKLLKQLVDTKTSSKQSTIKSLNELLNSNSLLDEYLKHSPNCKELFACLSQIYETISKLDYKSLSTQISDTNVNIVLTCIEKSITRYQQHTQTDAKQDGKENQRLKLTQSILDGDNFKLIEKCLQIQFKNNDLNQQIRETCVRLLTQCVETSLDNAKKIAYHFNYFNEYKSWLERFLLNKQTKLRELTLKFLISFLKHVKPKLNPNHLSTNNKEDRLKSNQTIVDAEYLILLKKIFFNKSNTAGGAESKTTTAKSKGSNKNGQKHNSSLIYCIFVHVSSDSAESIELLLEELLVKLIQNDLFTKSEKILLFNEKTLTQLTKLFQWTEKELDGPDNQSTTTTTTTNRKVDHTLIVREMIAEFLKVLFGSTRYGISFYDRTLNIDESDKNYNNLIFNSLINIKRPSSSSSVAESSKADDATTIDQTINTKTNDIIDDLLLKSLKVCPDLIQRFIKVKQKQETNTSIMNKSSSSVSSSSTSSGVTSDDWFIKFLIRLFEQQMTSIRNMKKTPSGSSSFLRSLVGYSGDTKTFLINLIVHTSLPLCIQFNKLLVRPTIWSTDETNRYSLGLKLLITCLKCLKEWKECVQLFDVSLDESNRTESLEDDLVSNQIIQILRKLLKNDHHVQPEREWEHTSDQTENFYFMLNFELGKYLPKFDQFCEIGLIEQINKNLNRKNSSLILIKSFEIFNLYFDLFINRTLKKKSTLSDLDTMDTMDQDNEDLFNGCFDLFKVETLENNLVNLIPVLLTFNETKMDTDQHVDNEPNVADTTDSDISFNICLKYLDFLIKYLSIKPDGFYSNENYLDDLPGAAAAAASTTSSAQENTKQNLKILNLVKIMFEYKTDKNFIDLSSCYLRMVNVCFNAWNMNFKKIDHHNDDQDESDLIPYDKSTLFLWFCLVKKHFIDSFSMTNTSNLFNEFVYGCLASLFSFKEINLILLQIKLSKKSNGMDNMEFSKLIGFICVSNFVRLMQQNEPIDDKESYTNQLDKINSFLFDFFFSSGLMIHNSADFLLRNDLANPFDDYALFMNSFVDNQTFVERLTNELNEKFNEIVQFKSANNKTNKKNKKTPSVNSLSESFMIKFEMHSYLKNIDSIENLAATRLSIDLRISHLFFILAFITKKNEMFELDVDLDVVLKNLKSFLDKKRKLLELTSPENDEITRQSKDSLIQNELSNLKKHLNLIEKIANNNNNNQNETSSNGGGVGNEEDATAAKKSSILLKINSELSIKFETNKSPTQKESTTVSLDENSVDLLEPLIKKSSDLLKEINSKTINDLIDTYEYTLSKKDQIILSRLYELDPTLECLLFNQNDTNKLNRPLNRFVKIADFISLKLNEPFMRISLKNFPIDRKLDDLCVTNQKKIATQSVDLDLIEIESLVANESEIIKSKTYDPIYLLSNIYNLLEYSNDVDVVLFVQSKCLAYLILSLSIECKKLRSLAYGGLWRFKCHLENTKAYFKNIILYLIELLSSSSDKENFCLPSIITVFLAESIDVITNPGTDLYKPITSFLLLKPKLDVTNVPEFFKLFNSSSFNFKNERRWILNVLLNSGCTFLDYSICEKRFVYRQLLAIYDSRVADNELRLAILKLIYKTCKCKHSLIDLLNKHYLLIWLTGVLNRCQERSAHNETNLKMIYLTLKIYILIWNKLTTSNETHQKNQDTSTPAPATTPTQMPLIFLNQMFILMKLFCKILNSNSKTSFNEFNYISDLFDQADLDPATIQLPKLTLSKILLNSFSKCKQELVERLKQQNMNLIDTNLD